MNEAYSKYFHKSPAGAAGWAAWASAVITSTQRHYEANGMDVEGAAKAGVRAAVRWAFYIPYAIGMLVIAPWAIFGFVLQALGVPNMAPGAADWGAAFWLRPHVPSLLSVLVLLVYFLTQLAILLLSYPYSLGVLGVRNIDRSLMRVNHRKWYKRLLPFAYRMRNVPDWKLYAMPLMAWIVPLPLMLIAELLP